MQFLKNKFIDVFYWFVGVFFDGLRLLRLWPEKDPENDDRTPVYDEEEKKLPHEGMYPGSMRDNPGEKRPPIGGGK